MNRLLQMRAIKLLMILVVVCLATGCSHLNVDFDTSWASRQISVVVVEHQQAPDGVTTEDISEILTRSGWHVVADVSQAQARVVCRWTRQPDLNSESEPVVAIKSFHVQVISVEQPKMLAVSDYFYSNANEELIVGVEAALAALTQNQAPAPAQIAAPAKTTEASAIEVKKQSLVAQPEIIKQPVPVAEVVPAANSLSPVAAPMIDDVVAVMPKTVVQPMETVQPMEKIETAEPVSMETSPWVPRFQGMGLEEWGKE